MKSLIGIVGVISLIIFGIIWTYPNTVLRSAEGDHYYRTESIVVHYIFNDVTGDVIRDMSSNCNNATIVDAEWAEGIQGYGLKFNGNGAHIKAPDAASLDISSQITISLWVNASSFSGNGAQSGNSLVRKWYSSPNGQYAIASYSDGGLKFWLSDGNVVNYLDVGPVLTTGIWHQISGTWNGSTMALYVDGREVGSRDTTIGSLKADEYSNDDLYVGGDGVVGSPWDFSGVIDEVMIRDVCFSPEEINSSYHEVWPIRLSRLNDTYEIDQGSSFKLALVNLGSSSEPIWTVNTTRKWLDFDVGTTTLSGTPDNGDVGFTRVTVKVSDGNIYSERCSFTIIVNNLPPKIITEDVKTVFQDEYYHVDYDSDEEGEPKFTWIFTSDARWLSFNYTSGVLNGTPTNDDVGTYDILIKCDDRNGGTDSRSFELQVINVNDPPKIITEDLTMIYQDVNYKRTYQAVDPDPGDTLRWSMTTNASWLKLSGSTIEGRPSKFDIGIYSVNISVMDQWNLSDHRLFDLVVVNVNDPPEFISVPADVVLNSGDSYTFDVVAHDFDPDDTVTYSIRSNPSSDIRIDDRTGTITWTANTNFFQSKPYIMMIVVSASDGEESTNHQFKITVNDTLTKDNTVDLISPRNDRVIPSRKSILAWSFHGGEDHNISYDIYMHQTLVYLLSLNEEALYLSGYNGTSLEITNMELGKKYFWTIIPLDGKHEGICNDGVWCFTINNPPTFVDIDIEPAYTGKKMQMRMQARDKDPNDVSKLFYTLEKAPQGMTLGNRTGSLSWTPTKDQVGIHDVGVNVSDGVEESSYYFIIEVLSSQESGTNDPLILAIVVGIIVFIIVAMAMGFIMLRKRGPKDDVMEEETIIGSSGEEEESTKVDCAVATTLGEAHANLGEQKVRSYSDLYGEPSPEEEEVSTLSELKDFINEGIKEIEEGKSEI